MNQRELAERHEVRKSKPEQHQCCYESRRYLKARFVGTWKWYMIMAGGLVGATDVVIEHCPWCGEKLPDRGRLKVEERGPGRTPIDNCETCGTPVTMVIMGQGTFCTGCGEERQRKNRSKP